MDASGWCPDPRCDGPLKPPSCKNGSGGGSSGGSSSSSSSSSGSDRSDSSGASSYSGGDGEASYVNYQYNEAQVEGDSSGEADYGEARVSDGVTNVSTSTTARSRFNMFWAFASLAAVGTLIGIFLLKKNKKKSEEDELDHQLTQSVSKRLEKLLEGKTVHAIHDDGVGPSFLEVGSKGSPVLAASLAKKKRSKKEENI
ncbi:expressed unknown protein [Seminavis robusta]|uniref:Uncharacterized protein n=1 Tax=Seminavis robusta TaxID=568900 RepID=A0A9N8ELH0_9STRA|nr:expressed unknown protein [Seminavis robusta]|eukprot:Sro1177_g249360.1 n/a (199) ;mRNA; f:10334-11114